MKCFHDPIQDAVGICKSCGKGLCPDHLTDLGRGLACRGSCEEAVRVLIGLIDHNVSSTGPSIRILKRSSLTAYGSGLFLIIVGAIFLVTGYRSRMDLSLYIGGAFLVYGTWNLVRTIRYAAAVAQLPEGKDGKS